MRPAPQQARETFNFIEELFKEGIEKLPVKKAGDAQKRLPDQKEQPPPCSHNYISTRCHISVKNVSLMRKPFAGYNKRQIRSI